MKVILEYDDEIKIFNSYKEKDDFIFKNKIYNKCYSCREEKEVLN